MLTNSSEPKTTVVYTGLCLLHAEYHEMQDECFNYVADWYVQQIQRGARHCKETYQLTWETAILERFLFTGEV